MPTISVENYLKTLYHLESRTERRVSTTELASHMNLSLPSTTNMLKSLAESGFVDYRPYKGATLTLSGRAHALKVIRNHRLIEAFLVSTLGYTWDEVHEEAEAMEHAISEKLADRIDAFLGHPEFDPHGDPIPRFGSVSKRSGYCLYDGPSAPATVIIIRVLNQDPEVLRYLTNVGLVPGVSVTVRERMPFDGPLVLQIDDNSNDVVLSRTLARDLLVEELSE
jgi:DtxR family Mn-dependent transcriptional regulator